MEDLKKLVGSKKFNSSSIATLFTNLMKSKNLKKIQQMLTFMFGSLTIDQINQLVPNIPSMIIKKLEINESREICQHIISKIKPQQMQSTQILQFESTIRQELSDIFSAKGIYDMAALHLSKANLEHPARGLTDQEKASKFISVAQYNLQMENTANADYYLGKVSALPPKVLDNIQQNLRFNVCIAREQDLKRNFHAAALNFYRLSNSPGVDESDLLEILKMSATCALLLNAGPKKSRLIATLMKDQRMSPDFIPQYGIIQALHENKVVKLKTLKELQPLFKQHQLVKGKFQMNLLELVMIEHNLLSLGQYFENISLQRMGKMVGLDKRTTQDILATMIEDGRVDAVIDEIDGMVEFEARDPGVRDDMLWKQFDDRVGGICKVVQDVIDQIQNA